MTSVSRGMFDADAVARSSDRWSDPAEDPGLRRVEAAGEAMLRVLGYILDWKVRAQRARLHDSRRDGDVGRRKYRVDKPHAAR